MSTTDTSMDPNHHATGLASHCRICGQKCLRGSETINKLRDKQMQELIQLTYNIEIHKDDEHIMYMYMYIHHLYAYAAIAGCSASKLV